MHKYFEKQWHICALLLCIGLATASWVIALYYWDKLPQIIPTHFGISGVADSWSNKTIWYVFLIPTLQLLMTIGFGFLYFRPQYSNMPTTMFLMTLDKKKRDPAFSMIRTMLVITLLFVGVFFTYLTFGMNYSALHSTAGLAPWVMLVWVIGLFTWLIWYSLKVYRYTKKIITKPTTK
jgi:uncharacterized membrane protein